MSEKNSRSEVLFEHTWRMKALKGDLAEFSMVRTFRIVGMRYAWEEWRLGGFRCEELYPDAMGVVGWHPVDDDAVPAAALGVLLQRAGFIDPTEDLSCLA